MFLNESTKVSMGHFSPAVIISFIGLILIAILDKKNVRGSILYGIVLSSLLAWGYALINPAHAKELGIYLPSGVFKYESMMPVMRKLDFKLFTDFKTFGNLFVIVCTFLFVDFFDTVGTLIGVCSKADMLDENGNVPNVGRALMADAIATTAGAALGVSTVTRLFVSLPTFVWTCSGQAAVPKIMSLIFIFSDGLTCLLRLPFNIFPPYNRTGQQICSFPLFSQRFGKL